MKRFVRRLMLDGIYLPVYFQADTTEKKIAVTVDDCENIENLRQIVRLFRG